MLAEDRSQRPRAGDVRQAKEEVQRVNAVFWNLQHFDRWSPFLNPKIGQYGAGDIHATMKQVQQEWTDGGAPADPNEAVIFGMNGDTAYSDAFFITAAVGFRSGDLPESFTGDAEAEIAAYRAAPLIVSIDEELDVYVNEELMQTLKF